jgi:DNA-binding MarR family transcriptional regulator/ribosomal protein S18 acetylase RimI-like enzyme
MSDIMSPDPIARIRRFNRAVTRETGALDSSFLGRGRPLGAARVLNAIGNGHTDIARLRTYLGLDSGLASRLLRGLEAEGLVETRPHPDDARRRTLHLTQSGIREFAAYESLSNARAARLLAAHPRPETLLAAMDMVASAIGQHQIEITRTDPQSDDARYCLGEYYAELGKRLATGFDVSLSRDPEAADMMPPRGTFLVARSDGLPIGCAGLKGHDRSWAEVKRVWVAPAARGLGLARRLMDEIEASASTLEIPTLRLDTNSALPEAVALYTRLGWHEIDRFNDDPYPDIFFEKNL